MNSINLRATLVAAMAIVSVTAYAQTPSAQTGPQPSAEPADAGLEEIVVTGSRVIKSSSDSPTPITSIDIGEMALVNPSGTAADQLNTMPQFAGSRGPSANPGGGGQGTASQGANPQANTLNLRNMGYTRTLILFDGHRVAPIAPDGTVDVDTIPQMLLKRVDVVTGGASAVYGSDAVTGVVNFVTDTKFNGLKVQGSAGMSHEQDDKTNDFGVAVGKDLFDGQGHIEASFETHNSKGIPNRSDREFGRDRWTLENPTNGALGPYVLANNVRSSTTAFGGLINGGPLGGQWFSQNGILAPFNSGTALGPLYHQGGDGGYNDATLVSPLDIDQLYVRFDYDINERIHTYAYLTTNYTAVWSQSGNNTLITPNGATNGVITLSSTDAFLPQQYQNILSAAGPTFQYGDMLTDLPAANVNTWDRQYQANLGIDVKLPGGYEWDTYYSRGTDKENTRQNANINTLNMVAALNAVVNPANGQTVCAVSLTANAALYPGCTPFNPFGPNAASPQAINYVMGATQFWATTTLDDVTTSLTGAPFNTWAGPVNTALSLEWRSLTYELQESGLPNDLNNLISCAGLPTYDCKANSSAQQWATQVSAPRSLVHQNVGEAALEFDAPLLKDLFMAKDLSLNGAARWTDYSTSGVSWTWKGGVVWHVNDELTFRGTRSKDIRAPTLNDLYLPASTSTYGGQDYVTGVLAYNPQIPNVAKGNPELKAEIGNTTTAGFVYVPKWLSGLSLSVDAFKIDVSNAITSYRGASNNVQLGCAASGGASAFCELVTRPIDCCSTALANTATELFTESLNLADQWTEGADFEADYNTSVYGHPLRLHGLATFQPQLVYAAVGSSQYNMAGVAFNNGNLQATPVWRATILAEYSPIHNFTMDVFERWRSDLAWGPYYAQALQQTFSEPKIASVAYTDLTLSYEFEHESMKTDVYFNVTNLFNKQPPPGAFFGQQGPGLFGGFVVGDDPVGAFFTLGFRMRVQ